MLLPTPALATFVLCAEEEENDIIDSRESAEGSPESDGEMETPQQAAGKTATLSKA